MTFRQTAYQHLDSAWDALFELSDAIIFTPVASSLAHVSVPPVFRRRWPSVYEAIEDGQGLESVIPSKEGIQKGGRGAWTTYRTLVQFITLFGNLNDIGGRRRPFAALRVTSQRQEGAILSPERGEEPRDRKSRDATWNLLHKYAPNRLSGEQCRFLCPDGARSSAQAAFLALRWGKLLACRSSATDFMLRLYGLPCRQLWR